MSENGIYETISKRTDGDIYIGVVGPVRTGKSTFIHHFMESVVIPNIENEYDKERTVDEMPQSGSGKTITTTEPKFVPGEAVKLSVGNTKMNVRMIDCVGYMVDGAIGAKENEEWRMVMTPWSNEPIPFVDAAEIGTEKVVREHSTVAVLVTTDGSITDIPRDNYIEAEARVVNELREAHVPFAIVLNSKNPKSREAHELASLLEDKYSAPVALVNCSALNKDDSEAILGLILGEFPITELEFKLPEWTELLPDEHPINKKIMSTICDFTMGVSKFNDIDKILKSSGEIILCALDSSSGKGRFEIPLTSGEYYSALSECSGVELNSDKELFSAIQSMAKIKTEYDKIKEALADASEKGYGIVMPTADELFLSEPEVVRQGGSYGIRFSAEADSIHMIKTKIKADVCPTFGTEEQSEEVMRAMMREFEDNPKSLLESKLLGRSLYELVNDGMNAKLVHMPDESRTRMGQTIEKIINEGAAGLICIII